MFYEGEDVLGFLKMETKGFDESALIEMTVTNGSLKSSELLNARGKHKNAKRQ